MLNSRRQLFHSVVSFAALLSVPSSLLAQQIHPEVQPHPSPNTPNPNFPGGTWGSGPKPPEQKGIDKQSQEQLRSDVEKLYSLAFQIKYDLSVTNTTAVLPLTLLKNAKQIEKLAKEIRELAKG